jgi:DNA-binding transcriptional regulator GbsR (MarR family)
MIHALRYTEALERAGFSADQAKIQVTIWMELMDQNFATKADFKEHYFMTRSDLLDLQALIVALKISNEIEFSKIHHKISNLEKKSDGDVSRLENKIESEVSRLENKIESEISRLENKMDKEFKEMKIEFQKMENRLLIKLGSLILASTTIMFMGLSFLK